MRRWIIPASRCGASRLAVMPSFGEADMSEAQEPGQHFVDMFTQDEIEALHGLAANKKVWWQTYSWLADRGSLRLRLVAGHHAVLDLLRLPERPSRSAGTTRGKYSGLAGSCHQTSGEHDEIRQRPAVCVRHLEADHSAGPNDRTYCYRTGQTAGNQRHDQRTLDDRARSTTENGEAAAAKELLQIALAAANSPNDEFIALRYLGFLEIRAADTPDGVAAGEALFQRAATLETKYDLRGFPQVVAFLKVSAQFDWAQAIAPINCQGAIAHYKDGEQLLSSQPPGTLTPDLQQARQLAQQNARIGLGGVPSCRPPA